MDTLLVIREIRRMGKWKKRKGIEMPSKCQEQNIYGTKRSRRRFSFGFFKEGAVFSSPCLLLPLLSKDGCFPAKIQTLLWWREPRMRDGSFGWSCHIRVALRVHREVTPFSGGTVAPVWEQISDKSSPDLTLSVNWRPTWLCHQSFLFLQVGALFTEIGRASGRERASSPR